MAFRSIATFKEDDGQITVTSYGQGEAYKVKDCLGGTLFFQGDDARRFKALWYMYAPCAAYQSFASCLRWYGYTFDYSEVIPDVDAFGNTPASMIEG